MHKPIKMKAVRSDIMKEINFLKNILSVLNVPLQTKGESNNYDYDISSQTKGDTKDTTQRARNITELEEKLQKMKAQNNFNLKNKLVKKSLNSKLSKQIKKRERQNKNRVKPNPDIFDTVVHKTEKEEKSNSNVAKPVFNMDGKLVFSKFDFANIGKKEKISKREKDPKKLLTTLKEQEQKIRELEETGSAKANEVKEKIAWKSALQKAEGVKVKDDPILLKKSIKKMEQRKKQSKKKWENRLHNVEQKKDERQKKRKENISKKKKEKKAKVVKAAVKRGRVVI
ncbi:hypothetical protein ACJJTC_010069 [Scirpophaga incertulas]